MTIQPEKMGTHRVATYQVGLTFEDGVTQFVTCRDDQTLADASYLRGINIPVDCTDGVCGTCKAFCESGSYEIGSHLQDALDDVEEAAGYMLPCVTKPRSNVVLRIACTSEVAKTRAASYVGTLVALRRLSATTMQIGVGIPNRAELTFLPGQYVNIAVPGTEVTRSYSFSNAQHEQRLTFLVKLTPGGAMSTYLTDRAAVGDEVTFTGPHGSFFLRETEYPLLLLAGGTGLAPILSMLNKLRHDGSGRQAHLIYGVNTDEDLVELDKLSEAAAELPGLTWDYCVVDPASTATNKGPDKAYVMSLISPEHLHDGAASVYTCGPPPMVDAVRKYFVDVDSEPIAFYYEKFALAAPAPTEEAPVEVAPVEVAPVEVVAARPAAWREALRFVPDARAVAGQVMLPYAEITGWPEQVHVSDQGDQMRRVAGQLMSPTVLGAGAVEPLEVDGRVVVRSPGARTIAGQQMFPSQLSELALAAAPLPTTIAAARRPAGAALQLVPDARAVAGQVMLPYAEIIGWQEPVLVSDQGDQMRRIAGQLMSPTGPGAGIVEPLEVEGRVVVRSRGARTIADQQMFPSQLLELAPIAAPPPAIIASDGYQIGEDHPGIYYSDALFTAREALELGALELTIGRLTHQQLTGYRLLAEATVPWISGDQFVDAAMWTETNNAFHDYLFILTGNEHLLQAYHTLGVKGRMTEVLHNACWIHPRSAQDHLDIVDAFQAGDRDAARELIIAHSERAIATMRRAMAE